MEYAQLTTKTRKQMRSEEIRKRHTELTSVREHGVKKYTSEWIYNNIAKRYWLAPGTIENIVFYRNGYD
jgi:hypothetical protein